MKNGILTLIFAFIPGAGQMYQGYMKRGLSLIGMFCAVCAAMILLEGFVMVLPVIWMYSFFDTFNLRSQLGAGDAPQDDYLVHFNWKDDHLKHFLMDSHKLVGWGLIALGALVLYENIVMQTLGDIMWRWGQNSPIFRAFYLMMKDLPQIFFCVALIVCGVWLVRGPRAVQKPQQTEPQPEDFCAYEPQVPALLTVETEDEGDGREED